MTKQSRSRRKSNADIFMKDTETNINPEKIHAIQKLFSSSNWHMVTSYPQTRQLQPSHLSPTIQNEN